MIEIKNLSITYNGSGDRAIDNLSLILNKGEFVLVNGPTGCGKSTLARAVTGLLRREHVADYTGSVTVSGIPSPELYKNRNNAGVGILFQNPDDQIIGQTVSEEISFGLENLGMAGEQVLSRIAESLKLVGLEGMESTPVEELSGGQKQRLSLASVLALGPDLLVLDEPTSHLDGHGKREFKEVLKKLRSENRTAIIFSHDIHEIAPLCHRLVILNEGRKVGAAKPGELFSRPELQAFLGFHDYSSPSEGGGGKREKNEYSIDKEKEELLTVKDVAFNYRSNCFRLGPLTFNVKAGERIALLGPNAGGKTTLLSLLAGLLKPSQGEIRLGSMQFGKRFPKGLETKVAYVTQNPDLMLHRSSVEDEVTARPRYLRLPGQGNSLLLKKTLEDFNLQAFTGRHPFALSQGQRQRLAMASALAGGAKLLLVDEPSTGQDRKQIRKIMEQLSKLAWEENVAVIFSTHDPEPAMQFSDRVLVIDAGRLVFDGSTKEFLDNETLLDQLCVNRNFISFCGCRDTVWRGV